MRPFGLFNVLASFYNYINKIFAKKLNILIIIYLDNIFIYIKNLSHSYVKTVKWLLDVLSRYKFFANLKKCQFYKDKIYFLNCIILAWQVKIEDKQINIVRN